MRSPAMRAPGWLPTTPPPPLVSSGSASFVKFNNLIQLPAPVVRPIDKVTYDVLSPQQITYNQFSMGSITLTPASVHLFRNTVAHNRTPTQQSRSRVRKQSAMDKLSNDSLPESYTGALDYTPQWSFRKRIGSGSFATVFLEDFRPLGVPRTQLCAVKRISKDSPSFSRENYMREIDIISRLAHVREFFCISGVMVTDADRRISMGSHQHEHFIQFIAFHEDNRAVFIIMEYMECGDLGRYLDFAWGESDAKIVGYQLLAGLKYMHDHGITHRDLKPAVSTNHSELPYLSSYSSCLLQRPRHGVSTLLLYIAPEIIQIMNIRLVFLYL